MKLKTRSFLGAAIIVMIAGGVPILTGCKGKKATSGNAGNSQAAAKSGKSASIPCRSLEMFKEDVVGFLVKKPAGWIIRYTTGIITILRDNQGQAGVLIYPIRPQTGFTLENFFSSFMNILKESSKDSSRVDYSDVIQGRGQVQAKVSGFIGGKTVIGEAAAFPSGPDYILTLYWAPTEELSSQQPVLKCIADSYQKAPGQPLVKLSGTYFETMAPTGWRIVEEGSNGVDFRNPAGDAGVIVGYGDFGSDPQPMTIPRLFEAVSKPCSPGQQPCFSKTKSYTMLAGGDAPDFKDGLGRTWKARAEEFDATMADAQNSRVHGVLTGMVMGGRHITGLYGWFVITSTRVSLPETWDRNSAATAIIQDNLKIIKASEWSTSRILPRNNPLDSSTYLSSGEYKNRVDAELSDKRREGIMGYETYRMPTTGDRFDIPLNSIPPGDGPVFLNPQDRSVWNPALGNAPQGYYQLEKPPQGYYQTRR
jgi:hypothetical protein